MLRLPKNAIEGLAKVAQPVEESRATNADRSLLWLCWALAKGRSRLQGASTPHSWLAAELNHVCGTMIAMAGGTTL